MEDQIHDELRRYVVAALGVSSCSIKPLGGGACRENYKVETETGAAYVLHTKEGPFSEQYRASIEYQRYLEGRGFSVARTLGTPCYLVAIDSVVHLCEYLQGGHLCQWSEHHAHELGLKLGQMHSLSLEAAKEGMFVEYVSKAEIPFEKRISRAKQSVSGSVTYLVAWLRRAPCPSLLSVFQAIKSDYLPTHSLVNLPKAYTHGDIQASNLLFSDVNSGQSEIVGLIDFERANLRTLLWDLVDAILLTCVSSGPNKAFSMQNYHALLKGYESVRQLSAEESRSLPDALSACANRLLLKKVSRWHWQMDAEAEHCMQQYTALGRLAKAIDLES